MGWRVEDDGFGVLFSQSIPAIIRRNYRAAAERFLAANDLCIDDIDGFAMHPGGAKVVDALEQVFALDGGALRSSRAILRDFGNMSAATVLFVLEHMLAQAEPPRRVLLSSLGPGFTAGFLILDRT
jgi:alkylresorcinol/alkylpyrone synthase